MYSNFGSVLGSEFKVSMTLFELCLFRISNTAILIYLNKIFPFSSTVSMTKGSLSPLITKGNKIYFYIYEGK